MTGDYKFECRLTVEDMLPVLNSVGPWIWHFRDSDSEGFYLITSSDEGKTKLRIIEESPGYLLEITFYPTDTRPASRETLDDVLLKKLLPAIGAHQIRAV